MCDLILPVHKPRDRSFPSENDAQSCLAIDLFTPFCLHTVMPDYLKIRLVFSLLCLMLAGRGFAAPGNVIHLRGSYTMLPMAQQIAEAYMHEHPAMRIIVSAVGSRQAHKDLLDGEIDVAMISGNLPGFRSGGQGGNLQTTLVKNEAIVVVLHPSNRLDNLGLNQLKNIFTGRVRNWKDVGGVDAPITVLIGTPGSGIAATWRETLISDEETMTPTARILDTGRRRVQVIGNPHAITYLPATALFGQALKSVSVDGKVADANPESWPLCTPLLLVTQSQRSPALGAFIDYFVRHGKQYRQEREP